VPPLLGRVFTREDDSPQSPRRAVLSHGYWQRRFGGARDAIGRSLILDGRQYEVIGILPPSFQFPGADPALLLPCRFNTAEVRTGAFSYRAIARLRPSVTLQEANADVTRMIPLSFDRFPFEPGLTRKMFDEARMSADVRPLAQDVIGGAGRMLWILAGTVGIVLLIACANVANLFLVRTEGRQQELALRAALGASRWRIANELFCESIGLALAAGAIGFLFAWAGVRLLFHLAPPGLPRIDEIRVDLVVLAFTFAIALVTGIVFGLIPVMGFGTTNRVALKEGGRSSSDTRGRHRGRNALVVSEIALALVLLVAAGLMIRTFVALRQVEPGFMRPHQVQVFRLPIPVALIQDPRNVAVNYEQIGKRIQQVPGVLSVGLSTSVTMDGNVASTPMFVEEFPEAGRAMPPVRRHKRVAPGYFETMGNPIIAGRAITWTDLHQGRPVVVVSENFARMYWKNPAEAIGKRVRQNLKNPWREIIGVVGDEHDDGLDRPATAIVYWPMLIHDWWNEPVSVSRAMNFVVRSGRVGSPGFLREIQQAVWSVHPSVPLASVRTLEKIQAASTARTSFALIMLAMAATVALLLGSVGIYGVIAYVAAQRTREIGIRVALGAEAGDVRRLFLRHGLFLASAGIAIGVGVSLALTRAMSALLFGVSPMDPATYATVSLGLACVALLATWLPARRASRVDPVVALRSST